MTIPKTAFLRFIVAAGMVALVALAVPLGHGLAAPHAPNGTGGSHHVELARAAGYEATTAAYDHDHHGNAGTDCDGACCHTAFSGCCTIVVAGELELATAANHAPAFAGVETTLEGSNPDSLKRPPKASV